MAGSWLIGTYSADYSLLCVSVVSMLMNTAPTTTILSCACNNWTLLTLHSSWSTAQSCSLDHCADSVVRLQHSSCSQGCGNIVASVLSCSFCSMWNSAHAANRSKQLCCVQDPVGGSPAVLVKRWNITNEKQIELQLEASQEALQR